jgi:DNA-binding NarL/FixJ family response regulator
VVVDDHTILRRGLRATLEGDGVPSVAIVGEAATASEAIELG